MSDHSTSRRGGRFHPRSASIRAGNLDPFTLSLSDFEAWEDITLPFYPGVYVLQNEEGEALYVGQSGNVCDRLKEHARTKKWYPDVVSILAYPALKVEERLVIETIFILRLLPRWNRAIKLGLDRNGRLRELQFLRTRRPR